MKVEGTSPTVSTSGLRRTRQVRGSGAFGAKVSSADAPDASPANEGVAAVSETFDLVALQEITGAQEERKRVVQQGEDMLKQLDRLRFGLLEGSLSPTLLHQLNAMLSQRPRKTGHKGLDDVMLAIEQRVAVELAKLEMSRAARSAADQGWLQEPSDDINKNLSSSGGA
ncbi:MAG: flagellar assembly protein FliX [Holosporales bacterium]